MKKIVFGLIAVVTFGNLSFGQTSFKDLFVQYKFSSKGFFSDLGNFENNVDIENNGTRGLKDEETFKNWIVENLSKTKYKNADDAITDYQKLVSQSEMLINDNLTFFREIEKNETEFLTLLDEEGMYESPSNVSGVIPPNSTNSSPCTFGCINDAVACNRAADQNFAATMGASGVGSFWNPIIAGAVALNGWINHRNAIRACVRTFTNCYNGC